MVLSQQHLSLTGLCCMLCMASCPKSGVSFHLQSQNGFSFLFPIPEWLLFISHFSQIRLPQSIPHRGGIQC